MSKTVLIIGETSGFGIIATFNLAGSYLSEVKNAAEFENLRSECVFRLHDELK